MISIFEIILEGELYRYLSTKYAETPTKVSRQEPITATAAASHREAQACPGTSSMRGLV
jgi:hypothetical protein